ncbi:hypothetical protein KIN20_033400 [Parelaphostrongylus tenuis]|uniref:Uncharacterized protein n=1 Tax=Parelaphostrongylus tenuis TaxID=148309 RepID=A0AAD5R8K3_PARTN|nr:hypothetical protein KIN20_033400 [Parelaphostrongylus tenuis]
MTRRRKAQRSRLRENAGFFWKTQTVDGRVCGQRQPSKCTYGNTFGITDWAPHMLKMDHHHGRQLCGRKMNGHYAGARTNSEGDSCKYPGI